MSKGGTKKTKASAKGGDLGFEAELFKAADKIRANMEPSDHKHVVLGLIFLKHKPHRFNIVPCKSPITSSIQISQWRTISWIS